jgi:hypothetical protein
MPFPMPRIISEGLVTDRERPVPVEKLFTIVHILLVRPGDGYYLFQHSFYPFPVSLLSFSGPGKDSGRMFITTFAPYLKTILR